MNRPFVQEANVISKKHNWDLQPHREGRIPSSYIQLSKTESTSQKLLWVKIATSLCCWGLHLASLCFMSHWKFLEAFIKIYFFRVSAEWLTLNIGFDFIYPFCLVLNSLASGIRFIVYFLNERFFSLPSSDSITKQEGSQGSFRISGCKMFHVL